MKIKSRVFCGEELREDKVNVPAFPDMRYQSVEDAVLGDMDFRLVCSALRPAIVQIDRENGGVHVEKIDISKALPKDKNFITRETIEGKWKIWFWYGGKNEKPSLCMQLRTPEGLIWESESYVVTSEDKI